MPSCLGISLCLPDKEPVKITDRVKKAQILGYRDRVALTTDLALAGIALLAGVLALLVNNHQINLYDLNCLGAMGNNAAYILIGSAAFVITTDLLAIIIRAKVRLETVKARAVTVFEDAGVFDQEKLRNEQAELTRVCENQKTAFAGLTNAYNTLLGAYDNMSKLTAKEIKKLTKQLNAARDEITSLGNKVTKTQTEGQQKLDELKTQLTDEHQKAAKVDKDRIAELVKDMDRLSGMCLDVGKENEALKEIEATLERKYRSQQAAQNFNQERLIEQNKEFLAENKSMASELKEANQKTKELTAQIQKLKGEIDAGTTKISELEGLKLTLETEMSNIKAEGTELTKKLEEAKQDADGALKNEIEEIKQKLQKAQEELLLKTEEFKKQLETKDEELGKTIQSLNEASQRAKDVFNENKENTDELLDMNRKAEEEVENLTKAFEELDQLYESEKSRAAEQAKKFAQDLLEKNEKIGALEGRVKDITTELKEKDEAHAAAMMKKEEEWAEISLKEKNAQNEKELQLNQLHQEEIQKLQEAHAAEIKKLQEAGKPQEKPLEFESVPSKESDEVATTTTTKEEEKGAAPTEVKVEQEKDKDKIPTFDTIYGNTCEIKTRVLSYSSEIIEAATVTLNGKEYNLLKLEPLVIDSSPRLGYTHADKLKDIEIIIGKKPALFDKTLSFAKEEANGLKDGNDGFTITTLQGEVKKLASDLQKIADYKEASSMATSLSNLFAGSPVKETRGQSLLNWIFSNKR